MRTQYTPKIIFSVFHKANSYTENYNRHWSTLKALEMAGVKTVQASGSYGGQQELSIVVRGNKENKQYVKQLCRGYQQEYYLSIDNEGSGGLVFSGTGDTTQLGKYKLSNVEPEGDFTKFDEGYMSFS